MQRNIFFFSLWVVAEQGGTTAWQQAECSACLQFASSYLKDFNRNIHQVFAGNEHLPVCEQRPQDQLSGALSQRKWCHWGNRGLAVLPHPALSPTKHPEKAQREEWQTLCFDLEWKKKSPFLLISYPCPAHSCPSLGAARAQSSRGFLGSEKLLWYLLWLANGTCISLCMN